MRYEKHGKDGAAGEGGRFLGSSGGTGGAGKPARWSIAGALAEPSPGDVEVVYVARGGNGGGGGAAGSESRDGKEHPGGHGGNAGNGGGASVVASKLSGGDGIYLSLYAYAGAGGSGGEGSHTGGSTNPRTGVFTLSNGPGGDGGDGVLGSGNENYEPGQGGTGGEAEATITENTLLLNAQHGIAMYAQGGGGVLSGLGDTYNVTDGGGAVVEFSRNTLTAEAGGSIQLGLSFTALGGSAGTNFQGLTAGSGQTAVVIEDNVFRLGDVGNPMSISITATAGIGGDAPVVRIFRNTIDGGDGDDYLLFNVVRTGPAPGGTTSQLGVDFDMALNTITNIERIYGNSLVDVIKGDETMNVLHGESFNDADGAGDILYGRGGDDQLYGVFGDDALYGDAADDLLVGGTGDDLLDGGAGIDTASYADAGAGVRVSLAVGGRQSTGDGRDTLTGIENLIGSGNDDVLTGSAARNVLRGGSGDDRLNGGTENDTLRGDYGLDRLTGGTGADRFIYADIYDSQDNSQFGQDQILDFRRAEGDKIDLSAIDANISAEDDQLFTFRPNGKFNDTPGGLVVKAVNGGYLVSGDVNGDRVADFTILVKAAAPLEAIDFVL